MPRRLDVPDFDRKPGVTHLEFRDNINRCAGHMHFETVGETSVHDDFVRTLSKEREREFAARGWPFQSATNPYQLRNTPGHITTFVIGEQTERSERVKFALVDVHLPATHLSIVTQVFCPDAALLDSQLVALKEFVESPQRPRRETTPAGGAGSETSHEASPGSEPTTRSQEPWVLGERPKQR